MEAKKGGSFPPKLLEFNRFLLKVRRSSHVTRPYKVLQILNPSSIRVMTRPGFRSILIGTTVIELPRPDAGPNENSTAPPVGNGWDSHQESIDEYRNQYRNHCHER